MSMARLQTCFSQYNWSGIARSVGKRSWLCQGLHCRGWYISQFVAASGHLFHILPGHCSSFIYQFNIYTGRAFADRLSKWHHQCGFARNEPMFAGRNLYFIAGVRSSARYIICSPVAAPSAVSIIRADHHFTGGTVAYCQLPAPVFGWRISRRSS